MNQDHINHVFINIMDVVRDRRRLRFKQDKLEQVRSRYNIDSRLVRLLENEYERTLEEDGYKMKTVDELTKMIYESDRLTMTGLDRE